MKIRDNEAFVQAVEPELMDLVLSYCSNPSDFQSTMFHDLKQYVLHHYFDNEQDEKKLTKNRKYLELKKYIENSNTKTDAFDLIQLIRN